MNNQIKISISQDGASVSPSTEELRSSLLRQPSNDTLPRLQLIRLFLLTCVQIFQRPIDPFYTFNTLVKLF